MPAGTESGVSLGSRIVLSNFLCRISARFCESFLDTLKLDV